MPPSRNSAPPRLVADKSRFTRELAERIEKGKEILDRRRLKAQYRLQGYIDDGKAWTEYTTEWLRRSFDTDEEAKRFSAGIELPQTLLGALFEPSLEERRDHMEFYIKERVARLGRLAERLPLIDPVPPPVSASETEEDVSRGGRSPSNRRVFVVHGHDDGAREAVRALIWEVDLEPIVLMDEPSRGQTLIQKLEENSDVGFAVVVFSPDDTALDARSNEQTRRARQNVIFELGYFVALLGRPQVCVILAGDIELPSDWKGVVNIHMDKGGGWRTKLYQELGAAKMDVRQDWPRHKGPRPRAS